jgi:hypothetical protein
MTDLGKVILLLLILGLPFPGRAEESSDSPKPYLPSLLLCGKDRDFLAHIHKGKIDWEYKSDGPLVDIQAQPIDNRFLVVGGSKKVFLLRKVDSGCRVIWDWTHMEGVQVSCATAADWDLDGNPTLILAGDTQTNRLFLAEAKSNTIKTRWEFKLLAAPRAVHICPDTGNFLVVMADSTIEEIYFQEDKVVWIVGKGTLLKNVLDAIRDPMGLNYAAEGSDGSVICFNSDQKTLWKSHLPFAHSNGKLKALALSLYKKKGKRIVMASAHFAGGRENAKDLVYLLNADTGKVLAWSDHLDKGAYPPFEKVVPDTPSYFRKQ